MFHLVIGVTCEKFHSVVIFNYYIIIFMSRLKIEIIYFGIFEKFYQQCIHRLYIQDMSSSLKVNVNAKLCFRHTQKTKYNMPLIFDSLYHKYRDILETRKGAPCKEGVFISYKLQEAIGAVKPTYSKTCVKWPLSKRLKIVFQDQLWLTEG